MAAQGAALITGASSGIGWATALVLAHGGWLVYAGVRREEDGAALAAAAAGIGAGALLRPIILDVTDATSVAAVIGVVESELREHRVTLAGLVNNAGIAVAGPVEEVPLARWRTVLDVNVTGAVAMAQACLPLLRAGRGRIVNISSVSGRVASPFLGPYAASKFALEALSDSLRLELAPWGVKVVLVEPGPVATPIWDKGEAMVAADRAHIGDASPYAPWLGQIRAAFRSSARRGIPPEVVAGVIVRALTTPHPQARYPIGSNRAAVALITRFAPDWVRDWLMTRGQ